MVCWSMPVTPYHLAWQVPWPVSIHAALISSQNPSGTISNSDLEMAGMFLHYLVVEHLALLCHVHVAAWCDNTPTISWTNKFSASCSPITGCLTRALAMCIHINEASPLTSLSIAGIDNTMADTETQPLISHSTSLMTNSYSHLNHLSHCRTACGKASA